MRPGWWMHAMSLMWLVVAGVAVVKGDDVMPYIIASAVFVVGASIMDRLT